MVISGVGLTFDGVGFDMARLRQRKGARNRFSIEMRAGITVARAGRGS